MVSTWSTAIEDDPSGLRQSIFPHLLAPSEVRTQSHSDARPMSTEHLEVTSMAVDHPEPVDNYVGEKTYTESLDSPIVAN